MIGFKKLVTGDQNLDRVQGNIEDFSAKITKVPIIDGSLLTGIYIASGQDNKINHLLDRQPRMWMIADQDTDSRVWRTAWDSKYLTLRASSSCTVSLWVA